MQHVRAKLVDALTFGAIFSLPFIAFEQATAALSDKCSDILKQSIVSSSDVTTKKLSYLKTIDSESALEKAKGAGGTFAGMVSGTPIKATANWSDFQQERSKYFEQTKFNVTDDEAHQLFVSTLPSGQVEAWKACMDAEGGLQMVATDISDDAVTVQISWRRPYGWQQRIDIPLN